jgi:hypothetical protein
MACISLFTNHLLAIFRVWYEDQDPSDSLARREFYAFWLVATTLLKHFPRCHIAFAGSGFPARRVNLAVRRLTRDFVDRLDDVVAASGPPTPGLFGPTISDIFRSLPDRGIRDPFGHLNRVGWDWVKPRLRALIDVL